MFPGRIGTAIMERMPRALQPARSTRSSVSESSQRSERPVRTHSPENPEPTCRRVPKGGASGPALARQTISLSLPCGQRYGRPGGPGEGQRPLRGQLERDLAIRTRSAPLPLLFLSRWAQLRVLHDARHYWKSPQLRISLHLAPYYAKPSSLLEALFHRSAAGEVAPA